VSDETASFLGRQLGAELIITGSIMPRGNFHTLNIRAVHVETAGIRAQWSQNVRVDTALVHADIAAVTAVVRFAGTALETDDRDSLVQDIWRALDAYQIPIEITGTAGADGAGTDDTAYNFLITLRINPRPALQVADLTIAFRRGGRVLKQSERHTFSEFNTEYIIRKGGEIIFNDRAFFNSLPGILAQQ
jgi:hypothetical protein